MKNTIIATLLILAFFASCKKDDEEIKGTRDLKNLSLQELKNFLNGKWRLRRAELFTIAGLNEIILPDSVKSYLVFYSTDSVKRVYETTSITIREKLVYEYLSLPGTGGLSSNVLKFDKDNYGYRNNWVADRLINDTLVFADYFRSEGVDTYFYTREQ